MVCLHLYFLGFFGAHRFYSGETDYPFIMVILTTLSLYSEFRILKEDI